MSNPSSVFYHYSKYIFSMLYMDGLPKNILSVVNDMNFVIEKVSHRKNIYIQQEKTFNAWEVASVDSEL